MRQRGLIVACVAISLFWCFGCSVSPRIILRDQQGREAACEGVTGLYGLRTHVLLSVQRQCVEDFQRQGYERMP